jgi:hypothetical protein
MRKMTFKIPVGNLDREKAMKIYKLYFNEINLDRPEKISRILKQINENKLKN